MKKRIIKTCVMLLVFLSACVFFAINLNQDNEDLTMAMPQASLPVVYFMDQNVTLNELHGYVQEMNLTSMRDSIVPVNQERKLHLKIMTYGTKVDAIRYEIRSIDGSRLVAKNDVKEFMASSDEVKAVLQLQNVLEENKEYVFQIILTQQGRDIYYYTRLMQTTDYFAKECLSFALEFHDYTFREDAGEFIPTYMDAATGDPTTLDYVDLSCTLKQITWADFKGTKLTEPVVSYKEINESYNVLTLQYIMSSKNESDEIEFYNVEEYYRLRYTTTRMYVLNFERRMNQYFRGENSFVTDGQSIQLGIRNKEIEYDISETGDVIAFVQEGELWCLNRVGGKLVRVFSFLEAEGMNPRETFRQHDIRIVRVDEAGSIHFVVYGYMNRGIHEGQVGTGVYHYDGIVHTVEEEVFIPSNDSYEILKAQMGQLLYANEQGNLYLLMDSNVYCVNLETLNVNRLVENLTNSSYVVSASNRYFAWVEGKNENSGSKIFMMDLSNGKTQTIEESGNVYLKPLGFIDEDLIYGVAEQEEVKLDNSGNTVFPMRYLKIFGEEDDVYSTLKKYEPEGKRIHSIEVEDYTIRVNLLEQIEGHYLEAGFDSIMNQVADTDEKVSVRQTVTEVKETQRQLSLKKEINQNKIKMITSKHLVQEEPRIIELGKGENTDAFYVYVKGNVLLSTDELKEAIKCANESLGVVVNSSGEYVWMRARKSLQPAFKGLSVNEFDKTENGIVQSVSALLNYKEAGLSVKDHIAAGETPKSILEKTLKDCTVIDVSGLSVDEVIFYVSEGAPVFAMTGTDSAVLITGYSSSVVYYFEPLSGATKSLSYEQAEELFKAAGSVFFTYLDE